MREASSKKRIRSGWRDFLIGALVGLIFSGGLFLLSQPHDEPLSRVVIHLLTPAGLTGFFGVLIGEWLRKRTRSSKLKYSVYGIVGAICGFLIYAIIANAPGLKLSAIGLYFSIWIGAIIGVAVRLSLDEIITESKRKAKNENETSK